MDDLFKKIQSILSGSVDSSKKIETESLKESNSNTKKEEDVVTNFMSQLLDTVWVEDELKNMLVPSYILSKKENSYWLLNTNLKIFMNIKSGVEIIPIEIGEKDSLCMIGHNIFKIPNEILVYAGWN